MQKEMKPSITSAFLEEILYATRKKAPEIFDAFLEKIFSATIIAALNNYPKKCPVQQKLMR